MLIAWAGFQNGLILVLNREPFAPFLLKPTIQTNHFIKNRWHTCLKYDEKNVTCKSDRVHGLPSTA